MRRRLVFDNPAAKQDYDSREFGVFREKQLFLERQRCKLDPTGSQRQQRHPLGRQFGIRAVMPTVCVLAVPAS